MRVLPEALVRWLKRLRAPHLIVSVCIAACISACGEAGQARFVTSSVVTTKVSYPSSAAYDPETRILLIGSYYDGSVQRKKISSADNAALQPLPPDGRTNVLRIRTDPARHRIWVLSASGLDLYDARSARLARRIPIDSLSQHSEEHCFPDIAVDADGNVVVSSAMQVSLMRVDADTFDVTHDELQLDKDQGQDFGFSALAFAGEDQRLYAASATGGTLWQIDLVEKRATKVPLSQPIWGACALHAAVTVQGDKTDAPIALYAARGFRDGVARIDLSRSHLAAGVTSVLTQHPLIAPTDLVLVEDNLLAVISQLSEHLDFKGDGQPSVPFMIVPVGKS